MTFAKVLKLNVSVLCLALLCGNAMATVYGVQSAWDNPTANMTINLVQGQRFTRKTAQWYDDVNYPAER